MRLTNGGCIFYGFVPPSTSEADLRELRNVVFNDLLNVCLHFRGNVTSCNCFKQLALSCCQVLAEFTLPLSDLVDRNRVQLQGM
jgi:hypothetical protein